jgi:hypothetical protein
VSHRWSASFLAADADHFPATIGREKNRSEKFGAARLRAERSSKKRERRREDPAQLHNRLAHCATISTPR